MLLLPLVLLLLSPVVQSKGPDGPASAEIRKLAQEDQADRSKPFPYPKEEEERMTARDTARRKRMSELLKQNKVKTVDDYDNAALLFQHGSTPTDYLIARELAIVAGMKGRYGSIPALAEDRFLVSIQRAQRFGSQSYFDKSGKQILNGINESGPDFVTDTLRLDFMIPPLSASKAKFEKAVPEYMPQFMARLEDRLDPKNRQKQESSAASLELKRIHDNKDEMSKGVLDRVREMYAKDMLAAPRDYFYAATVFYKCAQFDSHQFSTRLLLANELAAIAAIRGQPGAIKLFMDSWDGYAMGTHLTPRYGAWSSDFVDPSVAPGVRKAFGITRK